MNTLEQTAGLQRLAGLTLILTATLGFDFKKNTFGFSFYIDLQSAENKKRKVKTPAIDWPHPCTLLRQK